MGKNTKSIFTGIIFIILAFSCGTTSFYLLEVKPKLEKKEEARLKKEADLKARQETISLKTVLKQSQGIYSLEEQAQREGLMWVDHKTSRFVVTLGAIHGLVKGSILSVYDGNKRIGEVKVESALDAISYVSPDNQFRSLLNNDYYEVRIE